MRKFTNKQIVDRAAHLKAPAALLLGSKALQVTLLVLHHARTGVAEEVYPLLIRTASQVALCSSLTTASIHELLRLFDTQLGHAAQG